MSDLDNSANESGKSPVSLDLNAINAAVVKASSSVPDAQSLQESETYARAMQGAKLQSFTQDTTERKKYAQRIF